MFAPPTLAARCCSCKARRSAFVNFGFLGGTTKFGGGAFLVEVLELDVSTELGTSDGILDVSPSLGATVDMLALDKRLLDDTVGRAGWQFVLVMLLLLYVGSNLRRPSVTC